MTDEAKEPIAQEQPEETAAETSAEEADKLRQELAAVRKERDELLGRLQRVSADYANFQKRVPKQVNDSVAYEKEKIIRSFLPLLDNFDHMLKAHSGESMDAFVKGVEILYSQMLDVLKSHGVEQVRSEGEMFDPARHEAMMRRHEPGKPADAVLEELQKGYLIHGRLLRPSRVVVNARGEPPPQPAKEETPEEEGDTE